MRKKLETCTICKREGTHAPQCPSWQCPACGLIGGNHHDDCFLIRDAIKPARLEVNGEQARVIHARPIPEAGPAFGEVPIKVEWVRRLQDQFDLGKISIPGVKADDHCRVKESRPYKGSAVEVNCPHRAVLREVQTSTCSVCNAHKTNTIVYLCLLHAITHHGNGDPIADLGPLFVDPSAVAQSAEVKNVTPQVCPNCMEPQEGDSHFDGETFSCDDIDVLMINGGTVARKTENIPKKRKKS